MKKLSGLLLVSALGLAAPAFADTTPAPTPAPAPAPAVKAPPMTPPVTLHVGDPAPEFKYKEWIKGTEVKAFEPGKIYVIEFWATWCGWCKFSMAHLSEMAKKYDGQVTFISMDVWEHPKKGEPYPYSKVESFVKNAHDVMAYNVAADTEDGFMTKAWLAASGQQGIPACLVVQDGKIAYLGHPALGLEEALAWAVKGELTPAKAEQISKNGERLASVYSGILTAMSEALKSPEKFGKEPVKGEVEPTFAAHPAFPDVAIWASDYVMSKNTLWAFQCIPAKYQALLAKDPAAAKAYAEKMIADPANGPTIISALASTIVNKDNPHPDYALAKEAMDKVMSNSDQTDSSLFGTRALVDSKTGNAAEAVELQKQVVASNQELVNGAPEQFKDRYMKMYLQPSQDLLKEYEALAAAPAKS